MPHITIRIFENAYTSQQKQAAASKITEAITSTLNENPSHIEIHFIELKTEHVFVAGKVVPLPPVTTPKAKPRVTQSKKTK